MMTSLRAVIFVLVVMMAVPELAAMRERMVVAGMESGEMEMAVMRRVADSGMDFSSKKPEASVVVPRVVFLTEMLARTPSEFSLTTRALMSMGGGGKDPETSSG